jgi:hypothetical protein
MIYFWKSPRFVLRAFLLNVISITLALILTSQSYPPYTNMNMKNKRIWDIPSLPVNILFELKFGIAAELQNICSTNT